MKRYGSATASLKIRKETKRQEKAVKQQAEAAKLEEAKRTLLAMNGTEEAVRVVRRRIEDSDEDMDEDSGEEE